MLYVLDLKGYTLIGRVKLVGSNMWDQLLGQISGQMSGQIFDPIFLEKDLIR